jgi:ParB family transcriptional regulator, chromosome partitioning protein
MSLPRWQRWHRFARWIPQPRRYRRGAHLKVLLADAVGLDMADWWEPTANGYLNHVSKAQIMQALKEAGPDVADDDLAGAKKETLVIKAASQLAGKRWLPLPLRRPPS